MTERLETTDLFKGAYLLCVGGIVNSIRVTHLGRTTATFLITGEGLDRHNTDYVTGNAMVNPVQLRNSLNHLRDLLFNTLKQKREKESERYDRTEPNRHHQNPNRHHRSY